MTCAECVCLCVRGFVKGWLLCETHLAKRFADVGVRVGGVMGDVWKWRPRMYYFSVWWRGADVQQESQCLRAGRYGNSIAATVDGTANHSP